MLRVTHFELPADDPDGLVAFYEGDSGPINSISVPSVDEFVAKIESSSGSVVVPKMPVPGVGYLAYCKDPDGNVFCIMEEDTSVE